MIGKLKTPFEIRYSGGVPLEQEKPTIVFVYNAESGVFHSIGDYVQKVVSPRGYGCNLCAVTYGNLGMKNEWKTFIDELDFPVEFLHRDEFKKLYPAMKFEFPAAFVKRDGSLSLFIPHTEINRVHSLEELMILVKNKMKTIKQTEKHI